MQMSVEQIITLLRRKWKIESEMGIGTELLLRIRSAHFGMVRNTWVSYGRCLLIQRYFCAVYDYAGKAVRSVGIQKGKFGVTLHFSEIIELKFRKKVPYVVTHNFLFGFQ